MKNIKKITSLIYEAAVVKRLKRTGWQILGDNEESLGEHTFLTCVIAYFLAKQLKANLEEVLTMAIFHDFHESRTGDVDKISLYYLTRDQAKANQDIFFGVDSSLLKLLEDYEGHYTSAAKIVYEANIIALLVELKLLIEKGNSHAKEWLDANLNRLHIPAARKLGKAISQTSSQDWWKEIRQKLHEEFKNGG